MVGMVAAVVACPIATRVAATVLPLCTPVTRTCLPTVKSLRAAAALAAPNLVSAPTVTVTVPLWAF